MTTSPRPLGAETITVPNRDCRQQAGKRRLAATGQPFRAAFAVAVLTMRPIGGNGLSQSAVEVGGAWSIEPVSRATSLLIREAAALASSGTGAAAAIPAGASSAGEARGLHFSIQPENPSAFAGVSSIRCRTSAV